MNDQELTSGLKDFFAEDSETHRSAKTVGSIGLWILHLVVLAFALYSAYHGISATSRYHADNGLGMAAGIIGIVVIEVVLLGLYIAFFARRITGSPQQLAAGATALLGFTLSCLGIVGDSQMQAGMDVSGWLSAYLAWGLPIAPAFMALGAAVVMALEPRHLRLIAKSVKEDDFEEKRHKALMTKKTEELEFAKNLANMQLNSLQDAARFLIAARRSPEVQDAIKRSALSSAPDVLRAIGVNLPYGTVIEGQTVEPLPAQPATQQATRMASNIESDAAPRPRFFDRLRGRRPGPATADPALVAAIVAAMQKDGAMSNNAQSMTEEEMERFFDMYDQARRDKAAGREQPVTAPVPTPVPHANGQEATGNGGTPRP